MQNKELEWADIAYFSNHTIAVSNDGGTTISIDSSVSPIDFAYKLLAAASNAQLTLNAVRPIEERSENFPSAVETLPVLDEATNTYSKTVSYTLSKDFTLTKQEVEGL